MNAVLKHIPYRNRKILDLAKGQDCQHCGAVDGTNGSTVAAHQNGLRAGKGTGLKSDDHRTAYLCMKCHTEYDTHKMSQEDFMYAVLKTQKIWLPVLINH